MTKPSEYNYNLDVIRTIGIVCVIVLHVFGTFLSTATVFTDVSWWFAIIVATVAKIAVPLFIMLSGYLILDPAKQISLTEFYKKRLARIGIPVLFWPIFYYLCFVILSHKPLTLPSFINDYIFLNTFYHLYFLYIILGLYLIAPFLKKMWSQLNNQEKKWLLIGSFIFSMVVTVMVYFTQTKINYWSIFTVFIPFIGYFLYGEYIRNLDVTKDQLQKLGLFFLGLLGVSIVTKYFVYAHASVVVVRYLDDVLSFNVIGMSLTAMMYLRDSSLHWPFLLKAQVVRVCQLVSKNSFAVYIVHPMLLFVLTRVFPLNSNFVIPIWGQLVLEVLIILVITTVAVSIVRKIQFLNLLLGG